MDGFKNNNSENLNLLLSENLQIDYDRLFASILKQDGRLPRAASPPSNFVEDAF